MRVINNYSVNILNRTKKFSVAVINLSSLLPKNPAGNSIANQIVRSATSIGANLVEAQEAVSTNDFIHKISISLKEAKETRYWLEIIIEAHLIMEGQVALLLIEIDELVRILVATLKTLRSKK